MPGSKIELPEGIHLNGLTFHTEHMNVSDISVTLTAGYSTAKDLDEIERWVAFVLKNVGGLKTNPCKNVIISIFLTKFKKELNAPYTPLGPPQVNSGYAYENEEVVVYREEDWKKVFIHECFHLFGFDKVAEGYVGDQFPIPTDVDLKEVFSETNARLLHAWWTRPQGEKDSDFWTSRHFQKQVDFSLLQMVKVLDHFGLAFSNVVQRKGLEKFKETSNVFAYYVVTAILMYDAKNFWAASLALLRGEKISFPDFIKAASRKVHGSDQLFKAENVFRTASKSANLKMVGGIKKWKRTSTATKSSSTRRRLKK